MKPLIELTDEDIEDIENDIRIFGAVSTIAADRRKIADLTRTIERWESKWKTLRGVGVGDELSAYAENIYQPMRRVAEERLRLANEQMDQRIEDADQAGLQP